MLSERYNKLVYAIGYDQFDYEVNNLTKHIQSIIVNRIAEHRDAENVDTVEYKCYEWGYAHKLACKVKFIQ